MITNGLINHIGGTFMEQDLNKTKLNEQIKDAYCKVLYTETCHYILREHLLHWNNAVKVIQIVLSALSTGSFLSILISSIFFKNITNIEQKIAFWSTLISLFILIFSSLSYNFRFHEKALSHDKIANDLWIIRNKYISLLTDFDTLSENEIRSIRDELYQATNKIYKSGPGTTSYSYRKAQKQLKVKNSQNFTQEEINNLLPSSLL